MTTCPNCHSTAGQLFVAKDWNRSITDESFCYYRCTNCQLIFLDPIPQDLSRYYPPSYYPIPQSLEELKRVRASEHFKLDCVLQWRRDGRLLEIGGSYGAFASLAKDAGFDVTVVEMDPACCAFLANVVGVGVINAADPVAAVGEGERFDVIVLWQVIEHLPNPFETLAVLAHHLTDGGYLIIAAPNPVAFQFKAQGKRWPHVDAPRHLRLIPADLVTSRLRELGLQLSSACTDDAGSLHWNRFGWEMWAAGWVQRAGAKRLMHKLGRVIDRITAPLEHRPLRGSTYTLVYHKPFLH